MTLDIWTTEGSTPRRRELAYLCNEVARSFGVDPGSIERHFRARPDWDASIPVGDLSLREVEMIAEQIVKDERWVVDAVAAPGRLAQGGEFEATELVGVEVGRLFGVLLGRDEPKDRPDLIYLVPAHSRRFHRFFIDSGVLFWGDYGRILDEDVTDDDVVVDYSEMWALKEALVVQARVVEDRLVLTLGDGRAVRFEPGYRESLDSTGVLLLAPSIRRRD